MAKISTLQAVAPIPAFMAWSMLWLRRRTDAVIVALVFEGIGFAFGLLELRTPLEEGTIKLRRTLELRYLRGVPRFSALLADRASRGNVYARQHKQRTENCVEQDARAVRSPRHDISLLPSGCISQ
jgi:hypothetical protein